MTTKEHTQRIRELNDAFRATFNQGQVFLSAEVGGLPLPQQMALLNRVRTFADFSEDNDPYGEHDFGAFEHAGDRYFWKIDYYDRQMEHGSEDPADPAQTTRVLTIMRADEY